MTTTKKLDLFSGDDGRDIEPPYTLPAQLRRELRAFGRRIGLPLAHYRLRRCSQERAAVHEVGHVVAHVALFDPSSKHGVRLEFDGSGRSETWAGQVRTFGDSGAPDVAARIKSFLAGPLAEAAKFGPLTCGYEGDLFNVRALATRHGFDDRQLRKLVAETSALLKQHATFADYTAELLQEHGALLTERLRPLFDALCIRRSAPRMTSTLAALNDLTGALAE